MIPDNVEKIIMTKEDYDRNVEQLLYDKIKAEQEIERLHSIIKEVREYLDIDESIRKNCKRYDVNGIAILEILDKENKE